MTAPLHPTIALLQSSSLTSVVQQELERRIVQGELAPGAKLIEAALAESLGVSRGPVREAFRMLEETGLVRQEKNRGVFVRHIPLAEALEIFDLRAMMDESVGRHLAQHITPEQLRQVKVMVDAMERSVKTGDADTYHLQNLEFHDTLVAFTGNRKLTTLYRRLINELSLFRRINLADSTQLPVSASEHRGIVKAIASGDALAAGRAMRQHVLDSKQRTLRNNTPAAPAPAATPRRRTTHA
ncbi:MAG TPA: phosphonate utilization associated transcriptional regulator [Rubrivivax sp.]|nr:phosphonate utilization associated transcriptional regulator [Rubrivivax sp.]